MSSKIQASAAVIALMMALGASSTAFAKAHDQGVADGSFPEQGTGVVVQNSGVPGISAVVNGGLRGDAASSNGGDNGVEPVVGNGANEPD